MKRQSQKSSLNKKAARFKRNAKDTAKNAASFFPGLGLALSIQDTAHSVRRTARAANDYGNELIKEAKRQINRRNPFK